MDRLDLTEVGDGTPPWPTGGLDKIYLRRKVREVDVDRKCLPEIHVPVKTRYTAHK